MDLFGKKTQQELDQLQLKMKNLESRYSCMVSMHSKASEELRESTALVAAVNAAKKSKALHEDEKRDHDQKADEYDRKSKEITAKETELLAVHEKKKTSMSKEMRELKETDRAIKTALSVSKKRIEALEKEIQEGESKRDSVAVEIENLKTGRSNAETALNKAQEKQSELTGTVDKLTRQQEALSKSNLYLNQVVSRLNRHGDEDTIFASLEHDLQRFLSDDRTSGAMQVELKARPLLLVVDLGYDSLNFAAVRAGLVSGDSEILLQFESHKIEQGMGCIRFEALLAGWVWKRFSAIHPRLNKSVKEQNGVELSLPVSRRLLALLCQGAPQGEVEEIIVIDSEPFSVSLPLQREELVSVFLPLLGPDGELTGAIRRFLAEFKLSVDAIDRIVCMGWYGRLLLLRESLGEVFKRPVLVLEQLATLAPESLVALEHSQKKFVDEIRTCTSIVLSDPDREKREWEQKKRQEIEKRQRVVHAIQAILERKRRESTVKLIDGFKFLAEAVIDTRTNLMWALNGNVVGKKLTWAEAINWVKKLNFAGYSDWRLPTYDELSTFAAYAGEKRPVDYFDAISFVNVQDDIYWSSSTKPNHTDYAWGVSMEEVYVGDDYKGSGYYVWPVRDDKRLFDVG